MKPSYFDLFLELETLLTNHKGNCGFLNSAATISIGGDFEIPPHEWAGATVAIKNDSEKADKLLHEFWDALRGELKK